MINLKLISFYCVENFPYTLLNVKICGKKVIYLTNLCNNYKCTCCLYGAGRNDFDACNIHYEDHWKGWALKSRLLWALVKRNSLF